MRVELKDLGKLYGQTWIFNDINATISPGTRWGIKGHNGAGKSTLLQLIIGLSHPSKGKVTYIKNDAELSREEWGKHIGFTAPYLKLFKELKPAEMIRWSARFRPLKKGLSVDEFLKICYLTEDKNKFLNQYSTGMLQRFKIGLALTTESDLVILDEPTSNLDVQGKKWFNDVLVEHLGQRTLIVASNEAEDFELCHDFIQLTPPQ